MGNPSQLHSKDREEILGHIHSIFQAFSDQDRGALIRTHLPEFSGFTVRSRSTLRNREQYLNEIDRLLDQQHYIAHEITDEVFTFLGDSAVVSYIVRISYTDPQGKLSDTKLRVMDVYTRTTEGWNLAASSVSLHPDDIDRWLGAAVAGARAVAGR